MYNHHPLKPYNKSIVAVIEEVLLGVVVVNDPISQNSHFKIWKIPSILRCKLQHAVIRMDFIDILTIIFVRWITLDWVKLRNIA